VQLERAGVPTAVICSDEFGPLGRAEATVLGAPGLPLVAIPHPLADNDAPLVEAKARAVADEVVAALTGEVEALTERYRTTFTRLTQRRLEAGRMCLDDVCAVDPATTGTAPVASTIAR
jgi:hypothetical protein